MSETAPIRVKSITVRPEQVLTEAEAQLMQKIDREELPCPRCASPLTGEKFVSEVYTGVMVECLKCGFREL
jgi:hypothetical protein